VSKIFSGSAGLRFVLREGIVHHGAGDLLMPRVLKTSFFRGRLAVWFSCSSCSTSPSFGSCSDIRPTPSKASETKDQA
jgi:hypothetical protein